MNERLYLSVNDIELKKPDWGHYLHVKIYLNQLHKKIKLFTIYDDFSQF